MDPPLTSASWSSPLTGLCFWPCGCAICAGHVRSSARTHRCRVRSCSACFGWLARRLLRRLASPGGTGGVGGGGHRHFMGFQCGPWGRWGKGGVRTGRSGCGDPQRQPLAARQVPRPEKRGAVGGATMRWCQTPAALERAVARRTAAVRKCLPGCAGASTPPFPLGRRTGLRSNSRVHHTALQRAPPAFLSAPPDRLPFPLPRSGVWPHPRSRSTPSQWLLILGRGGFV